MPAQSTRLRENAPGPFFVNGRCINCGTCWQFDPQHFAPARSTAHVFRQPSGDWELQQAQLALQACPVAAIQASPASSRGRPTHGFPVWVTSHEHGEVFYCGWASRKSFGACSWLVQGSTGNVLIDVPRWSAPLARRIRAMGGLNAIVLTHRDDVADHQHWSRAFGCERVIHRDDADAAPDAEHLLEGLDPSSITSELQLIPTPGHTAGSICALLGEQQAVLFSGDHLWWNRDRQVLVCSEAYCWWDFHAQIRSLQQLEDLDVAWLLPAHGHRHFFEAGEWRKAVQQTLQWVMG